MNSFFTLWILLISTTTTVLTFKPHLSCNNHKKVGSPNVFITVHVEDDTVTENVKQLQQKLVAEDPRFNSTFQKLSALHITFDVFYLEREDLPKAKTALEFAATMSSAHFGPLNITLRGIEAFNDVVLVSRTTMGSKNLLTKYQRKTNEIFKSFGFTPLSKYRYKPHMTLAELRHSHPELMHKWDFLLNYKTKLGNFTPKKLQLCAMAKPPDAEYYPVLAEAYFL